MRYISYLSPKKMIHLQKILMRTDWFGIMQAKNNASKLERVKLPGLMNWIILNQWLYDISYGKWLTFSFFFGIWSWTAIDGVNVNVRSTSLRLFSGDFGVLLNKKYWILKLHHQVNVTIKTLVNLFDKIFAKYKIFSYKLKLTIIIKINTRHVA